MKNVQSRETGTQDTNKQNTTEELETMSNSDTPKSGGGGVNPGACEGQAPLSPTRYPPCYSYRQYTLNTIFCYMHFCITLSLTCE